MEGKSASQIASSARPRPDPQRRDRQGSSPWPGGPRQIAELRRLRVPAARRRRQPRIAPPRRAWPRSPLGSTRGATALAIAPEALSEAEPEVFESVVVPMSLRVTIVELKEAMCRWPLGDPTTPEFRYCGSPAASGPYCAYHGRLAYQPAQERRRERDRRAERGAVIAARVR